MERALTRQQVETQLAAKKAMISRRVDALEHEVVTTGADLKKAVVGNPWVVVGGALLAGAVVGYILMGRKRRSLAITSASAQKMLIDRYVDAVMAQARHAVTSGKEAGEAVREALRDRVPLIVYQPQPEVAQKAGFVKEALDLMLKTALGLAVKSAIDRLTTDVKWLEAAMPGQTSQPATPVEPAPQPVAS